MRFLQLEAISGGFRLKLKNAATEESCLHLPATELLCCRIFCNILSFAFLCSLLKTKILVAFFVCFVFFLKNALDFKR